MKIALVVQRFGEDIIGGAESHCLQVALRLSKNLGWTVHVYTTTAFSYQTWAHFYPEGEDRIQDVIIYRYKSKISRWPKFFGFYNRFCSRILEYWGRHPQKVPRIFHPLLHLIEYLWFVFQGPWCPKLIKDLVKKKEDYDRFIFFTYLYYPAVFGLPEFGEKGVLVPLAHPEAPLNFPRVRKLLNLSPILYANTQVEKDLLINKAFTTEDKVKVVGCGLDDLYFQTHPKFPHLPIPGLKKPYICYLGRISKGKGVSKLIDYFLQFILETKNEDLSLVLAGENDGSVNIFYHPQIKFIGFISHNDKTSLIAHSACVVNPSPKESLSLLALEAIALEKPLLVNAKCDVLRYYAQNLQTVFDFHTKMDFNSHLTRILHLRKTPDFKDNLKSSKNWVQERYSWDSILAIYKTLETRSDLKNGS